MKLLNTYKEAFFEMAIDMVCVVGYDGYFKEMNQAWESVLGHTREELLAKPYSDFVHPHDRAKTMALATSMILDQQACVSFENRCQCKDGSYKWLSWNSKPNSDNQCVFSIVRDVTEQHKIREINAINESRLEAFIRHTPISIAMFDDQLHYIAVSDHYIREFKLQGEKIIGTKVTNIIPDVAFDWNEVTKKCLAGHVFKQEEIAYFDQAGQQQWFSLELRPWRREDNSIGGLISLIENITFRKIAQEEVTRKSQMLNGILKYMPVAVYRIDASGMITQSLGSGLKALGSKKYQLIGRPASELVGNIPEILEKVSQGEIYNFTSQGDNEGVKWYYDHYTFPDNVNNEGIIGFALDITDKKHAEKELQIAKENAEKASWLKTRFLANMSHEIRTPLNAIIGFAEVLQKQDTRVEQQEYLEYITSSGKLLLKLIGDVLDLSKIEEGKLVLVQESFHFQEVISSAILPYKYRANEKGLHFHVFFDERIPAYVVGDPYKLNQVIVNLIGNALKFTRQGAIDIQFACQNNPDLADEAVIRISVSDTGIGVSAEKQAGIFESFTQADSSIVREYGGSGLGLSIVQELVKLMDSEIHLISPYQEPVRVGGAGSSFWFILNLKIDKKASQPIETLPAPANTQKLDGHKILVVEDNLMNQKLIRIILRNLGCVSEFANNGLEALEMVQKTAYSLVFMDVQMPVMDGLTATKSMRQDYNVTLPIIGLTANVYKEDVENCLQAGMNDFLGKPFNETQIYDKLMRWCFPAPAEQPATKQYTDLTFCKKLANNDAQEMKELIELYLEVQTEFMQVGMVATEEKEWEALGKVSHKLKSSLQLVGLEALTDTLHRIEQNCKKGENLDTVPYLMKQAVRICEVSSEELRTQLAHLRIQ